MKKVFIGMGSNMADPLLQLNLAKKAIASIDSCRIVHSSSIYQSKALTLDEEPQDDYLNAVLEIETELSAETLLSKLQNIENQQGRVREKRWAARTLDLDLLLYGEEFIQTENLTVPHAEISNRSFVIVPLYEIDPQLDIPGSESLKVILDKIDQGDLKLLGAFNE